VILSLDLIPSVHLEPNGPVVAFFPQSQTRRGSTSRGGSHADEPPPSGVGARFLHRPDLCDTAEIANRWEEFSPWMAPCSALPTGRCGSRRNPQHRRANTGYTIDGETSRCGAGKKESVVKALQGPWPDLQVSSSARSSGPRRVQAWLR
jgi:hypothetical protein